MEQSRYSDKSLNQSNHEQPRKIRTNGQFKKKPVFANQQVKLTKTSNQIINALVPNRSTGYLQLSEELQDHLVMDDANSVVNIVTFMGSKKIGKSFLIDYLISKEEKFPSRLLSKNSRPFVCMPTFQVRGRNNERVLFFDIDGEPSNQVFLWSYFLSNVIVLNLNKKDRKGQQLFLSRLECLKINLQANSEDLTQPQLIILQRDCSKRQVFQTDNFLKKIENYQLFSQIKVQPMANPGSNSVSEKQIRDVPEQLLNPTFIQNALNLFSTIKSAKAKTIKDNYFNSKIAGITLQPLTRSINKTSRVNVNKIWSQVIETLSVGYYNIYIKKYIQELQQEFADEQPCDKYTLYKKLIKVKRNIQKKLKGFDNISGDSIFQNYRQKLLQKIANKEKSIKEINRQKSIKKNNQLCKHIFSQINEDNCEELIKKYNQLQLEDGKTEILIEFFGATIKNKIIELQKFKNPSLKPTTEVQQLQKKLKDLQSQIQVTKNSNAQVADYDLKRINANIAKLQKDVSQKQQQLKDQRQLQLQKKATQSKDITQLQNKIQGLRQTIKEQQKQIEKLRAIRAAQNKSELDKINSQIDIAERRLKELTEEVTSLQAKTVFLSNKKSSCCEIM